MKKQWCIPLLFLGVLCSAFPLEFRLDGGASRWGFSARGNGISQPWNGGAPVSVTMTCELFNAPGVDRPVMPWQSWTGILMEDGENRYIGGLLCPGNRTPEVDYGAVVYEKRGNFSWKNSGKKFRLAAGPLVLRFSFDGKELVLEAGKSVDHLEVVWKKTPPHGFLPKRIGFVLDTAQAGSVMDRFAVHSFTVRGKGAAAEWNLSDRKSWRRDFLTLKPLGEKREVPCTDLTDRLNRELARKSVRIGRGSYTFGSVRMPEGASLIFEDGAELRIGDRSEIRILGDRCRIEGGLWNLECFSRKAPLLVGKKVSGVTVRGITVSGFGKQNLPRLGFDFAYFDSCADLTVEENRIAGVTDCFRFLNCRRVTVRNNRATDCERMTSFQNASEALLHTGNWSDRVRFQCQWWGGDADDRKAGVPKKSARLTFRKIKPGTPEYDPNTAGVYDIVLDRNIAENGMCLAWGSKGRNILISNNIARFMSDLAYDTEGGENVVISGNISINSKCAGIGGYFYGSRLLITGNQILVLNEGEKKFQGSFLRLHSPGNNTRFGNGKVLISGNQFINEVNPNALLLVEAARDVVIAGNTFSGGGIRLLAEAEHVVISGNTMETAGFQKNPLIGFSGNRLSSRILINNLFRNPDAVDLPAVCSDERHTDGTLLLSGNWFDSFRREVLLKGSGVLKGNSPRSAAWNIGKWK